MPSKSELRKSFRKARRDHVAAQPGAIRALLFHHPPRPILQAIDDNAVVGLYHAAGAEAPAASYARFFHERGHTIALPRFESEASPMTFAQHIDPFGESDLSIGPFDLRQPANDAETLIPDILFVPVVGFTESCRRLGQGGGHYDRWLAEHPVRRTIGLAWDVQLIDPEDALPHEAHDVALHHIVTPTRIYGHQ